ncbi:MAG: aminotransferase class IV family protein [Deltaproteobacteria bacterium]|nr:aminotransferase class IV family protein [Deltaproteobacteria bacterium]MBP6831408.1 aminotransferase class IV family protein [Deltaproteobacteria bacterium]
MNSKTPAGAVGLLDGRPLADGGVSVFDRGFLYGDGVFEVLRTYRSEPWRLEEHLGRLALAARRVGITVPISNARWIAEVRAVLSERPAGSDSVLRLALTRGVGSPGLDPSLATVPTRLTLATPLPALPASLYQRGLSATLTTIDRATPREGMLSLSGVKSSNYQLHILALRDARGRGFDDALLLSSDGALIESTSANVFVVSGLELRTPSLESGPLDGITRAEVLSIARELGVATVCSRLDASDLWTADEVFLTSSVRELVPVVRVDDHEVGDGAPGPLTRRLHAAYRARTPLAGDGLP